MLPSANGAQKLLCSFMTNTVASVGWRSFRAALITSNTSINTLIKKECRIEDLVAKSLPSTDCCERLEEQRVHHLEQQSVGGRECAALSVKQLK
jgi:hypothetical protein